MRQFLLTIIAGWVIWVVSPTVLAEETNALPTAMSAPAQWPAPTNVSQPWTRWWWLGSAVDDENLTRLLETYQAAGLGGVEITSIYGVEGADDRELPFLSKEWVAALRHSVLEAKRLGMGVDLPTGSGWRTGGPSVTDDDANTELVLTTRAIDGGKLVELTFDNPPQALVAVGDDGQSVDLSEQITGGKLAWEAPPGKWTLYTASQRWSKDNVKRPAPGGEGKNINPLSRRSIEHFLDFFGKALGDVPAAGIRAQFHDSYEYEGNWCDDFFAQFETRRGYRLQDHLPELHGDGNPDDVARVKHDYRETVSDLIRDNMIGPWTEWSHENGMLSRNQSHGSPANWLDLYATCDIPEIESFGRLKGGDTNPLVFKFASSAAHVTGKPLVSSESATWLEEHFNETLGEVKEIVDRLFLGGVNHIFYHGTAYSPADAAWPGWLFYASTELNPQNPIWRDFAALNKYVTRVQSALQSTKSDNDILLYWPIHEYWQDPKGLRKDLRVHNSKQWFDKTTFGKTANSLAKNGYTFDYISDRQLADCSVADGAIETSGESRYRVVLVAGAKLMPLKTLQSLINLGHAGATIGFVGDLPTGPPGVVTDVQLAEWKATNKRLESESRPQVFRATDVSKLPDAQLRREVLGPAKEPLAFIRRAWSGGHVYFIKNQSQEPFDGPVEPAVGFASALIMDPHDGRVGLGDVKLAAETGKQSVRLQLEPGQSLLVKTYRDSIDAPAWKYREPAGQPSPLDGLWGVEFIEGGPVLPPPVNTHRLASWSEFAGTEGERFAGTARYTIRFTPDADAKKFLLDLGDVAESARVELNGKPVATLIGPPYRVEIEPRLAENNLLTIEVTSTAANRIRDLDRRKVKWRIFKDINLVGIGYKPFDASKWPVRDAGLLGPVTLTPLAD
jgi:alpha-L-rhamnosidase